jgi:hypothetical protein
MRRVAAMYAGIVRLWLNFASNFAQTPQAFAAKVYTHCAESYFVIVAACVLRVKIVCVALIAKTVCAFGYSF